MNYKTKMRLAILAFLCAGALTVLIKRFDSAFLFYALYPGLMVGLAIHGVHGGTEAEEFWGMVAGFVVNFFAYYLLFLIATSAWYRLKEPQD
jgi:hypothetical protein